MTREEKREKLQVSFSQIETTENVRQIFNSLIGEIAFHFNFTGCITGFSPIDNSIKFYLYFPDDFKITLSFFVDSYPDNPVSSIFKNRKQILSTDSPIDKLAGIFHDLQDSSFSKINTI